MEAVLPAIALGDNRTRRITADPAAIGAGLLGFAPVFYLAMSGGGYDIVARSEVGIVIWWTVLLGVALGVLPRGRLSAGAWIGIALLGGFMLWTWLAAGWSQSAERSLAEVARLATYLGFLVLGCCVVTRATLRPLLNGLAAAIAVVSLLAVLSRLVPAWFPADSASSFYATARLAYPFDYADAVGEFAALGLPLLLFAATSARTLAGRALAAAGLPVVILCLGLTVSRGGIIAAVVGVVAFFALVPNRLPRLVTAACAAAAGAVVMYALLHRSGVRNSFLAPAPASQRESMLAVLALACAAMAAVQMGVGLVFRYGRPPAVAALIQSRRAALAVGILCLLIAAASLVALVASGVDHRLWQDFKKPNAPAASTNQYFRLFSISGSHRYQYWQVAVDAFNAHPWKGIGPGTFEFYWAQHNSLSEFVRNAHSLYLETLAEAGIVGVALVAGFFLFVIAGGTVKALRAPIATRNQIGTAVAAFAAFAAAAAFDWVWQIGAIAVVGALLAAGALCVRDGAPVGPGTRSSPAARLVLAAVAIAAVVGIVVPLAGSVAVRNSQAAVRSGDYRTALNDAASAQRLEPGAATPRLQRALVLERLGNLAGASRAITEAQAREPTNWRVWLIGSRISAEAGDPRLALTDYRRARSLNPTSTVFAQ